MICSKCGVEVQEGTKFCVACGNPVEVAEAVPVAPVEAPVAPVEAPVAPPVAPVAPVEAPVAPPVAPVPPVYYPPVQKELTKDELPAKFKPIGAWAYFGYQLLFSIPLVGFILLIIFSLSDDNINRRNFARSYWCSLIIVGAVAILVLVLFLMLGHTAVDLADEMMYY
ncbi:MAG: zinc ribbon domain-containing protein [Clostridia bacterium]|nr:zinc ribbon domain-containing protein [Clostridia bacterium]